MPVTNPKLKPFDYQQTTETILKTLRRDRDRQIIARRFGFGLPKRQTLEKIGQDFGITRERVRQIEKATLNKIRQSHVPAAGEASQLLLSYLKSEGGLAPLTTIAAKLEATEPSQMAYVLFLASLSPEIAVIDEDDHLRVALGRLPKFDRKSVQKLAGELVNAIKELGQPTALNLIAERLDSQLPSTSLRSLAQISKDVSEFNGQWGLSVWPAVNPRSIRDKTYLILNQHQQPLHFNQIAQRIRQSRFSRRDVTVQAVHNELIKDPRFILIGRGIYALAEWGYTPGTVADIISEILRDESPLHKDQIIERVLQKRQVKTTTIILNLQEKDQFERVAKATYRLKQ